MSDNVNTTADIPVEYGMSATNPKDVLANLNKVLREMDGEITELEERLKTIKNNKTILIQSIVEIAKKASE